MPADHKDVHVAVAVTENDDGQFLIAKRPKNLHQGGLWEFPGGKVEKNEPVFQALKRELFEEVNISISHATPIIRIPFAYEDKTVLLDVWRVNEFSGKAFGKEGQQISWIEKGDFSLYQFPLANKAIINAIQLPDKYMISGEFKNKGMLLEYIQSGLKQGIKLIQFRAHHLDETLYFELAKEIYQLCVKSNAKLLLNTSLVKYKKYRAQKFSHGLHLSSKEVKYFLPSELDDKLLIATSVHNQEELSLAESKKVDFCVLSPVNKTLSHPDSLPLGWEKFKQLTEQAAIPVYALGGMGEDDLMLAKEHGGQGICAIGTFWGKDLS